MNQPPFLPPPSPHLVVKSWIVLSIEICASATYSFGTHSRLDFGCNIIDVLFRSGAANIITTIFAPKLGAVFVSSDSKTAEKTNARRNIDELSAFFLQSRSPAPKTVYVLFRSGVVNVVAAMTARELAVV